MEENAKGRVKEAYGAITGDEAKKQAKGRAQQRKERRRKREDQAGAGGSAVGREGVKQERKCKKGLLGGPGGTLSGRWASGRDSRLVARTGTFASMDRKESER